VLDDAGRGSMLVYMNRITVRAWAAPPLLALSTVLVAASTQPDRVYERIYRHLGPAGGLGVMLAALFAISALVGIVIMLLFALREINRSGPHTR
jgi:hypothetical protein